MGRNCTLSAHCVRRVLGEWRVRERMSKWTMRGAWLLVWVTNQFWYPRSTPFRLCVCDSLSLLSTLETRVQADFVHKKIRWWHYKKLWTLIFNRTRWTLLWECSLREMNESNLVVGSKFFFSKCWRAISSASSRVYIATLEGGISFSFELLFWCEWAESESNNSQNTE